MSANRNGAEIELADDNDIPSGRGIGGRKYAPVFAHDHDRAVLEMSSIDPSAPSSSGVKWVTSIPLAFLLRFRVYFAEYDVYASVDCELWRWFDC